MSIEHPYYPIIYVRGYAGSESEVEDTTADPYMGFNIGATKVRQLWTGKVERHFFESPLVRLMKEEGYRDVYEGGAEMPMDLEVSPKSVFIYRYYEEVSKELGTGERVEIEHFAEGLSDLILRIRDRVCIEQADRDAFRVYLVAHSMGGLVCRCFLQNDQIGDPEAKRLVDKVFTYATPHNGIDLRVLGNVPGFFSMNNANTFARKRMKQYLALPESTNDNDVASLNGKFDPRRFFCLVGTNDHDYRVSRDMVRRIVGPMSDGLVRIANATVWGPAGADPGEGVVHSPRAFVHRSHSGHYGIVNSEDGYQNLNRFLFGDVRVDGWLEISELSLPPKIQAAKDDQREIRASYHFDAVVRVRGGAWDLHRRTTAEGSAVFRTYDEMFPRAGKPRSPFLFSTFLYSRRRVNARRASLGFSVDLGVHVPRYSIDRRLWLDEHHEGGYLFRDKLNLEATPPRDTDGVWKLKYGWDFKTPNRTTTSLAGEVRDGNVTFRIPVTQRTRPGIAAELVLKAMPWRGRSEARVHG